MLFCVDQVRDAVAAGLGLGRAFDCEIGEMFCCERIDRGGDTCVEHDIQLGEVGQTLDQDGIVSDLIRSCVGSLRVDLVDLAAVKNVSRFLFGPVHNEDLPFNLCPTVFDRNQSWRAAAPCAASCELDMERRHHVHDDVGAGAIDLTTWVRDQRAITQYADSLSVWKFLCHLFFSSLARAKFK